MGRTATIGRGKKHHYFSFELGGEGEGKALFFVSFRE
jgi:hypothetical protein